MVKTEPGTENIVYEVPKVVITVIGGLAEVTQKPEGVEVIVIDRDTFELDHDENKIYPEFTYAAEEVIG